jgi:hypothetical protein
MKTIRPIILAATILLFLEALPAEAILYLTGDPHFGPDSVTIDTSTGLGWLRLTETTGLSYDTVLAETQPGGVLSGYRFATLQEVVTLYSSAGIPTGGYYPVSSPSIQSLISLLGPTGSNAGYPGLEGWCGTPYVISQQTLQDCPGISAGGLNSSIVYYVTGPSSPPGFLPEAINPALSYPDLGSWLVKEVPEPSETGILVLSLALWAGFIRLKRKQRAT